MKPFAKPESQFMVLHNSIWDDLMPVLTGSEWKVLSAIIRATRGWGKVKDKISYSQLKKKTGIGGSATIAKALQGLTDKGLVIVERKARGSSTSCYYSLNLQYEITSSETEPVDCETSGTSSEIEPVPVQKLNRQKKEDKEVTLAGDNGSGKKRKLNPVWELAKVLGRLTLRDFKLKSNRGFLLKKASELHDAEYTEADLVTFYHYWKKEDWRGKAGETPTPGMVVQEIAKACRGNGAGGIGRQVSREEKKRKALEVLKGAK